MRIPKSLREQHAAQYLLTTLCVWDVEQRWDLDFELMSAWDWARFDDPYRRVLLPKYPATRQGVLTALALQWDTPVDRLGQHVAQGQIFPAYAKPWDVAIDSLQKLTALVRFEEHFGTRLWRVAAGTLDLHQAYREEATDREQRSAEQQRAKAILWEIASQLHPDDVAVWIATNFRLAMPGQPPLAPDSTTPLRRYRLFRDLWSQLGGFQGQDEQAAFLAFVEAEAPARAAAARTADLLRWTHANHGGADAPPCLRALGLAWPCTAEDVKRAYHHKAHEVHPDKGGSAAAFQALETAYKDALDFVTRTT